MIYYRSDKFSYLKNSKTFIAEDSDFGKDGFRTDRIFNDACDLGFVMISAKTGRECRYYHADTLRNSDGEVLYWVFEPVDSIGKGTKVHVYND